VEYTLATCPIFWDHLRELGSVGFASPDQVNEIKDIVDDVIKAILSAMDTRTRAWTERWLYQTHIPQLGVTNAP